MFSQNSSREVRSFCEWKRSLVSGIIARGSDTFWETAVNIVPMQRAVLAIAMCALESDVTWRGWFRFEKHQFETEHEFWFELWNESIRCHALICDQPRIMLNHDVFVSCLEKKSCVPACKCKEFVESKSDFKSKHSLSCVDLRSTANHVDSRWFRFMLGKEVMRASIQMYGVSVFELWFWFLDSNSDGGKYLKWSLRFGPVTLLSEEPWPLAKMQNLSSYSQYSDTLFLN